MYRLINLKWIVDIQLFTQPEPDISCRTGGHQITYDYIGADRLTDFGTFLKKSDRIIQVIKNIFLFDISLEDRSNIFLP